MDMQCSATSFCKRQEKFTLPMGPRVITALRNVPVVQEFLALIEQEGQWLSQISYEEKLKIHLEFKH